LDVVRGLIKRVVLTPVPDAKGFEIELIGEIAAMIRLACRTNDSAAVFGHWSRFARAFSKIWLRGQDLNL
jgi:hypothetical protein